VAEGFTEKGTVDLKMNLVIQIVMISAAALMIIFCKAQPKKAVAGPVWQSGMVAVVAIYGIAWLADTYFSNYMSEMQAMLADIVKEYPWSIAIVFFLVSVLINSQGAVVVAMLPLAYKLGIDGPVLLGVLPAVYGHGKICRPWRSDRWFVFLSEGSAGQGYRDWFDGQRNDDPETKDIHDRVLYRHAGSAGSYHKIMKSCVGFQNSLYAGAVLPGSHELV
jgi:hypothetical protein